LAFPFLPELLMRHVLSALVQNVPGVLSHISGMLASRGYNIDSLAVGETEDPRLSRMTFVVVGDDSILEQVRKQLEKIVTVVRVDDVSSRDHVERDLMLVKVGAPHGRLSEIRELVEIFRAQIVDVSADVVMIEISGKERKIEAFIELMRPFGIIELVRSGRIAMVRGQSPQQETGNGGRGTGGAELSPSAPPTPEPQTPNSEPTPRRALIRRKPPADA
jgi:acetolactate synthase-1/3 small subunit